MSHYDKGYPPVTLIWRASAGPLVAAVDDEIVALGLAGDRFVDGRVQEIVAFGSAQRLAQIGGILLAEAHVERAGAGDAHAIAGLRRNCGSAA